jgi:putative ABC transport system permease protein
MGLKRASVALGLWYELLAITGLCLVLGLGIGLVAAQPVCDVLLQSQIEAVEGSAAATNAGASAMPGAPGGRAGGSAPTGAMTTQNGGAGGFSGPGGMVISGNAPSNAQPLSEMQISIEPFTILEIVLIALVLASLAGVVSVTRITRYEPIKILMERN